MSLSPTQRSLKLLRSHGFLPDIAERWVPFTRIRKDLLGVFDLVCVHPDGMILGVQVTTAPNMSARRRKLLSSDRAKFWLRGGARIILHGWKQKRSKRWFCKTEELRLVDFPS